LEQAYQAAHAGYMRAYGQVHERPFGKFCYAGWIDRAYTMLADATDEMTKKRMGDGIAKIISMAQSDFVAAERTHADYVDMCNDLGVVPQPIEPGCQCELCKSDKEPTFSLWEIPL
jgi:hypothetical protein